MIVSSVPYSHLATHAFRNSLLLSVVESQNILARAPSNTAKSRKGSRKQSTYKVYMDPIWVWSEFTVSIARTLLHGIPNPQKKDRNRSTVGVQEEEVIYFPEK